ncbi:MAG: cyclic nucleotide-binding domain-containing protein [Opitutales bacterium]|nr:cyclic nucleotide-binding domain-containing protein [Opitutales bacterium]NRA28145.1 HEAT repeat domain-containing protein [Opitutales bacterium]
MMNWLTKILRIYPGEIVPVSQFVLLSLLMQAGLTAGITAADSIFFVQEGVDKLPVIYIAAPVMMLFYIPLITVLLSRFGIEFVVRFSNTILLMGGVGLFAGFYLSGSGDSGYPTWLIYTAKLYTYLWYVGIYSTLWNYIDTYFDLQTGKRVYGLFSAGAALGAMLGGALVKSITEYASVEWVFLVWSACALAAFGVLAWINKTQVKLTDTDTEDGPEGTFLERLSHMLETFNGSRFAILITLLLFSTLSLTSVCEFITMGIFSEGRSEEELAGLFGMLTMATNGLNLFINLFLFNKLVAVFGVRNMAFIQPIAYLAVFLTFSFTDAFAAAFLGYMAYQTLLVSIDNNNYNFLFNALPNKAKEQIRTFIEGFCEPCAAAIAGIFLLTWGRDMTVPKLAGTALAGVAAMFICVALLRNEYIQALVRNLRSTWLDLSISLKDTVQSLSRGELNRIITYARSDDYRSALTAIRFLWLRDQKLALESLIDLMPRLDDDDLNEAARILEEILVAENPEVTAQLILWIEDINHTSVLKHPRIFETLVTHGLLSDASIQLLMPQGTQIARHPMHASGTHDEATARDRGHFLQQLADMLHGGDSDRVIALKILNNRGERSFIPEVIPYATHENPSVRLAALEALAKLSGPDDQAYVRPLIKKLRLDDQREVKATIDMIAHTGDMGAVGLLIERSNTFTPSENLLLERTIATLGKRCVPIVVESLLNPRLNYRSRECAAQILSHISFYQLEVLFHSIVREELKRSTGFADFYRFLAHPEISSPALNLLPRYYSEQTVAATNFILSLYQLMGRLPDMDLIRSTLYSDNIKERGNAAETVSQSCGRIVSAKIFSNIEKVGRYGPIQTHSVRVSGQALRTWLSQQAEQTSELEWILTIQAMWELKDEAANAVCHKRLVNSESSLEREQMRELIKRSVADRSKRLPIYTPAERIWAASQSQLLDGLDLFEITHMIDSIKSRDFEPESTVIPPDSEAKSAWFVHEGSVDFRLNEGDAWNTLENPQAFGHEAAISEGPHQIVARAGREGCRLFEVDHRAIQRAIDVSANVGIHFLTLKVGYRP